MKGRIGTSMQLKNNNPRKHRERLAWVKAKSDKAVAGKRKLHIVSQFNPSPRLVR